VHLVGYFHNYFLLVTRGPRLVLAQFLIQKLLKMKWPMRESGLPSQYSVRVKKYLKSLSLLREAHG
jgi:hypothetical protein